jgi:class 3 adenylate cyclase
VSRLETLLRSGADEALFRINPVRFASERNIAENEAIDLFLNATLAGLVEMDWLLYCPLCSDVVANFRSLRSVDNHFHCHLCHADYETTLDDYIAVTFTVAPAVRRIRYHDPESLPLEDYFFTYRATLDGLTEGGAPLMELMKSGVRGLARLAPNEASRFQFEAEAGTLLGTVLDSDASFAFAVTGERHAEADAISIAVRPGACEPSGGSVTPGPLVIEARNETDRNAIVGVVQIPPGAEDHGMLTFRPFLSGKRLLMIQSFRDNFRSEVVRAAEGIAVRDVTLLFTDLKGSTALYERIGDLNAYVQVQRHFERLLDVTVKRNGAVNKTIGDAVMAAFPTAADAVTAALDMRNAAEELNQGRSRRDFILKIGIHRGAAIAVTLNDRLDYFGQTVNIASRVQNIADGDEICLTEEVRQAPGVSDALALYPIRTADARLKGIEQTTPVYIVGDPRRSTIPRVG